VSVASSPVPTPEDALRIGRAIVGETPTAEEIARWIDAVATVALPLAGARDARLWRLARRGGPWTNLVDAGLGLLDPHSPVRHRLYLMLAVLEASPAHVRRFEPRATSPAAAMLGLFARGALGAVRAVVGAVVVAWAGALAR
jgi:hypothetical protein